jgi:hypothetical protein
MDWKLSAEDTLELLLCESKALEAASLAREAERLTELANMKHSIAAASKVAILSRLGLLGLPIGVTEHGKVIDTRTGQPMPAPSSPETRTADDSR